MRIGDRKSTGPQIQYFPIPRPETVNPDGSKINNDIIFHGRCVQDSTEFEKVYPLPKPPLVTRPNEQPTPNFSDIGYQNKLNERSESQSDWIVLKTIEVTPNLVWETVDMSDPKTWSNYKKELADFGLNSVEIAYLTNFAVGLNSLNLNAVEEARQRFLASRPQAEKP